MPSRDHPGARAGAAQLDWQSNLHVLIPAALVALLVAMVVVTATTLGGPDPDETAANARAERLRKLPPYWTVRKGDTYARIAEKTGLTIAELETFNPYTDPSSIIPGQRLKLRLRPPRPAPKPLGPKWRTVRSGDSFGSIAAATDRDIATLLRLNPRLKPEELQPGDRVRLRR